MKSQLLATGIVLTFAAGSVYGVVLPEAVAAEGPADAFFLSHWTIGPQISSFHYEEPRLMEEDGVLYGVVFSATSFLQASASKNMLVRFEGGIAAADGRPPECRVTPPVLIGKGCRISGESQIGPYVTIGDGAVIEDCRIANSIIEESAVVRDAVLDGSIVGIGARVTGGGSSSEPASVVLGDGAAVDHTPASSGPGAR